METTEHIFNIPVVFALLPVYVCALFGLECFDAHKFLSDTVHNSLVNARRKRNVSGVKTYVKRWSMSLSRRCGHVFAELSVQYATFYTVLRSRNYTNSSPIPQSILNFRCFETLGGRK